MNSGFMNVHHNDLENFIDDPEDFPVSNLNNKWGTGATNSKKYHPSYKYTTGWSIKLPRVHQNKNVHSHHTCKL